MKFPPMKPPTRSPYDSSDEPNDLPGLTEWLADEPPAVRPDLMADLLGQFELPTPATVPVRRRGVAIHLLAAAALVLVCVRLRSIEPSVEPSDTSLRADLVLMEARIDRLREELRALQMPMVVSPLVIDLEGDDLDDESVGEPIQRLAGADPGLLRIVTARRSEERDPERAETEYRDLLRTYPDGPAAIVARERLIALAR